MCGSGENRKSAWTCTQVYASFTVSVAAMVTGYTASYAKLAIASMKESNNSTISQITVTQELWIKYYYTIFAIFGGLIAGPLVELVGRKTTMVAAALPTIIAWFFLSISNSIHIVYFARCVSGFGTGMLFLSIPIYLAETLHPRLRGSLGLLPAVIGNGGARFLCNYLSQILSWRGLALVGSVIPGAYLCLMHFIPGTPRWYVSINEPEKAEASLQWLRGPDANISEEFDAMRKVKRMETKTKHHPFYETMFKEKYVKPTSICLGLMFFQQGSGISAVLHNTKEVYKAAGFTNRYAIALVMGSVYMTSSVAAALCADRLGRKVVLTISASCMALNLIVVAGWHSMKYGGQDVDSYAWIALSSVMLYIFFYCFGYGPIPWLMMGEILPASIRGYAAGFVTAFHWGLSLLVAATYKIVQRDVGNAGVFWMYCLFCLAAIVFTNLAVPETRWLSLETLDDWWKDEEESD